MRTILPLVIALAAACGGKKPPPRSPLDPAQQPAPPPDPEEAAAELAILTREGYRLLAQGYDNVYLDGLAHDARLILIDVGPGELQVGFHDGAAEARRLFDEDDLYELWSKRLSIIVAADGGTAWTHDDLSYRVQRDGREAIIPLRVTALYERRDGRWTKALEHVSYAFSVWSAATRAIPITAKLESETAGEAVGQAVRELIVASLTVPPATPAEPDALAIGIAPEVEVRGAMPSALQLGGSDAVELVALRVEVGRSGTVAWAAGLLRLTAAQGTYDARATWVLERRRDDWRLVQTHLSAPITEELLSAAVFGDVPPAPLSAPP